MIYPDKIPREIINAFEEAIQIIEKKDENEKDLIYERKIMETPMEF